MDPRSLNFGFLKRYDKLESVAGNAERDWHRNPVGALIQLRLFAELLAREVSVKLRITSSSLQNFTDVIERLAAEDMPGEAIELLHDLRRIGNDAAHRASGNADQALAKLRTAHLAAVWFQRTFHDPSFRAPAFVKPVDPSKSLADLAAKVAKLEAEAAKHQGHAAAARAEAEAAKARAEEEELRRQIAEETAAQEAEEKKIWEQLARENEKLAAKAAAKTPAARNASEVIREFVEKAKTAAKKIQRTEADTRREIDEQLARMGWEVDSEHLRFSAGARPEEGRSRAIAEWPTESGPADYALFVGEQIVGVAEAKRETKDVAGDIVQAKRYGRGFVAKGTAPAPGSPWGEYRVPFLFSTNGRPYVKQFETKSGIWFLDARSSKNHPKALQAWPTPDGLLRLLKQDIPKAHAELKKTPIQALRLRDYQNDAILAVEAALARGQDRIMLAMATGTGKTRTAIGLVYRLIESGRFHRVLFVVDRTALGIQAANAFKDTVVANEKTFAQIFGIKELDDVAPDRDTRVHIATVQGLMQRIVREDDPPAIDDYDCIIVDECHRGYTLDREMSETEALYRNADDFVSKYRRVIDYFSAAKIGLTATPALHTVEIFGEPVFYYRYPQAVIDKVLVPQEPERVIETYKTKNGISYRVGDTVAIYKPQDTKVEYARLADDLAFEVDSFNRTVVTPPFDRAVCEALAQEIDPSLADKTLVFCVDDAHADRVVGTLKTEIEKRWGPQDDDLIEKITSRADNPLLAIRRLRNEQNPKIAVTVDLLTTGIDIPAIVNLVFMRQVQSRILYEQMKGRATRLCPEINKESFRVFDAVGQCELMRKFSDMHATAVQPQQTFTKLFLQLVETDQPAVQEAVMQQIVMRLRRKRKAIEEKMLEEFRTLTGMEPHDAIEKVAAMSPAEGAAWMVERPRLFGTLDGVKGDGKQIILDEREDTLLAVRQEFDGKAPEDYLESFGVFVKSNLNKIPALSIVATRPRDLTRKQLRELADALASRGYDEIRLRNAWRHAKNEDIAASLIGYIRQQAVGDALLPYEQRVRDAMKRILGSRKWTTPQRQWLERIGKQLTATTVVDRAALDEDPFRDQGGFEHINQVFDGKAEEILGEIGDAVWKSA